VKQSIQKISAAVLILDTTIQAYIGGELPTVLVEGTMVLAAVANVHFVNREGFDRASLSGMFSADNTVDIVGTAAQTVYVTIPAATKHLREKQALFGPALAPIIIASATLLETDHDTFSAAMAAHFNPSVGFETLGRATDVAANIHLSIQNTIVCFTTLGLTLCDS
ncbi:hypothetical protein EJ02DRAFT_351404, partial [Clathrospora elynae]